MGSFDDITLRGSSLKIILLILISIVLLGTREIKQNVLSYEITPNFDASHGAGCVTNCDSVSISRENWIRSGRMVLSSFTVSLNSTAANTYTAFDATLPGSFTAAGSTPTGAMGVCYNSSATAVTYASVIRLQTSTTFRWSAGAVSSSSQVYYCILAFRVAESTPTDNVVEFPGISNGITDHTATTVTCNTGGGGNCNSASMTNVNWSSWGGFTIGYAKVAIDVVAIDTVSAATFSLPFAHTMSGGLTNGLSGVCHPIIEVDNEYDQGFLTGSNSNANQVIFRNVRPYTDSTDIIYHCIFVNFDVGKNIETFETTQEKLPDGSCVSNCDNFNSVNTIWQKRGPHLFGILRAAANATSSSASYTANFSIPGGYTLAGATNSSRGVCVGYRSTPAPNGVVDPGWIESVDTTTLRFKAASISTSSGAAQYYCLFWATLTDSED